MQKTHISVAMATYNGEKYIQEQLDSLAKQTVLPYELVVCDDGSKDKTVRIIEAFASSAPFPVHLYVNESNLGYADNFLKAAALCNGNWIAFCDQDDVWLSNKFSRVCEIIARYSCDELVLIGHTSEMGTATLELTGQKLPDFKRDKYIKCGSNFGFFCIVGFSMVFKAALLHIADSNLRPRVFRQNPKTPPGHDQWIGMLANAVGDIAYISEPLAIWRRHDLSLTTPPINQSIVDVAQKSLLALNPEPYNLVSKMASESAESFRLISKYTKEKKMQKILLISANKFSKLSKNFLMRANLYQCNESVPRILALLKMLRVNAYGGAKFNSLGWKSFAKDFAFAIGLIG